MKECASDEARLATWAASPQCWSAAGTGRILTARAQPPWCSARSRARPRSTHEWTGHVVPASASPSFDGRTPNYSGCSQSLIGLRTLRQVPIRNAGARRRASLRPGVGRDLSRSRNQVRRAELRCRCCPQMTSRAATSSRATRRRRRRGGCAGLDMSSTVPSQAVVNDQARVLNWTHLPPLVAWT